MPPSPGRSRAAHRANTRLRHIGLGDVASRIRSRAVQGHQDVPSVNPGLIPETWVLVSEERVLHPALTMVP